ncbi:MAG: hypothetical protein ABSG41_02235 [Bryobacteraceae bacterium]|jgi:hypothetical protein
MRITALSAGVFLFCIALLAADRTPFASISGLATALSQNDPDEALSYFDSQMKDFGTIEANIEALTGQTDVSCAIDIVNDEESDGVHKLDLDWFMELKPQGDNNDPQIERRRLRVQVEMKLIKNRWKITSLSPLSIFDPIQIR